MKTTLIALALVLGSAQAMASTTNIPCATDKAAVRSAKYDAQSNTTAIRIALLESDNESGPGYALIKAITYTAAGYVEQSKVSTSLNIKVNVFKGIRICQLTVSVAK